MKRSQLISTVCFRLLQMWTINKTLCLLIDAVHVQVQKKDGKFWMGL